MKEAPIPQNEEERLMVVHKLAILDTQPEIRFDSLTREAVEKLNVPISMISIIDSNREWYKSCQGLDMKEGSRKNSFCGHALLASNAFIIEDTLKDQRFADNPGVTGYPFIRFYAGIALRDIKSGLPIGVFCVKDTKPRQMSTADVGIMLDIANRAEKEINKV